MGQSWIKMTPCFFILQSQSFTRDDSRFSKCIGRFWFGNEISKQAAYEVKGFISTYGYEDALGLGGVTFLLVACRRAAAHAVARGSACFRLCVMESGAPGLRTPLPVTIMIGSILVGTFSASTGLRMRSLTLGPLRTVTLISKSYHNIRN